MLSARANEPDRNDPVLQQSLVDDFTAEMEVLREALVKLREAQEILKRRYKIKRRTGYGPGKTLDELNRDLFSTIGHASFSEGFYTDRVLSVGSTYIRNAAAFENPTTYEDGEDY